MAKTDNEELAQKVRSLHDDLNDLRDEAFDKGSRNIAEHLKLAGRALDVVYEYDRAEAPAR